MPFVYPISSSVLCTQTHLIPDLALLLLRLFHMLMEVALPKQFNVVISRLMTNVVAGSQ